MKEGLIRSLLVNPSPNTVFILVVLLDVLIAFVSAGCAILLPLVYPEGKPDPSPVLWHICTSALGVFFGLMAGLGIHPTAPGSGSVR